MTAAHSKAAAAEIACRIARPAPEEGRCSVLGCTRPTQRAAGTGLSAVLCRPHVEYSARHGSPWCRSPSAALLDPYLSAARSLIAACRDTCPFVKSSLARLRFELAFAPTAQPVTRLRGMPPRDRARQALARLSERGVKPETLLSLALAVHALIEAQPERSSRTREWRQVAIGKATHRRASGTHRVYRDDNGRVLSEMHAYSRSSGQVLRHLGEMIEQACEPAIERHLAAVVALARKRMQRKRAS